MFRKIEPLVFLILLFFTYNSAGEALRSTAFQAGVLLYSSFLLTDQLSNKTLTSTPFILVVTCLLFLTITGIFLLGNPIFESGTIVLFILLLHLLLKRYNKYDLSHFFKFPKRRQGIKK